MPMPTEILVAAVTTLAKRNARRAAERRELQKRLADFPPATDRHRAWMERRIAELKAEERECTREIIARMKHINARPVR